MNDRTNPHYLERGNDPIRLSEMVQRRKARARLADDFQEGKLTMLFNRDHKTGPVKRAGRIFLAGFLSVLLAGSTVAQNPRNVPDVTAMSMEDLMNLQVTSVSKRTQKVADAAAAIFVLTQEDIRRSGATSIPEALRLVPGLEVARIDQNKWAIGSRGFNGRFDNKLLVLIDGRSVYTPLFSGVYWNVQDVMLEDVDRIEVIRGPGATLWGANAVDGVINVITKKAKATQSAVVTAGAGTEERAAGGVRYGSKLGDNTYYRAYTKYFDWRPSVYPSGVTAHDGWDALRGGFRADWTPAGANSLTVQGDVYRSRFDETLTVASLSAPYSNTFPNDGKYSGGNILGRWNHTSEGSSMSLQMYYDNTTITDHSLFGDHQNILDIDFQDGFHAGNSQQFVWGLGYRSIHDKNDASFTVSLQPNQVTLNQFSTFLQDEISLVDNRLQITLGSKFERNEFTGFEIEPNARLLWNLTPNQSIWTAVSRAVRTPALTEEGLRLNSQVIPPGTPANPTPLPAVVAVFGSHQFNSEDLLAYELGYRVQATKNLSLDIATFYNNYSNLRTAEPGAPYPEGSPAPTDFVIPFVAGNKMSGGTYGVELFADWKVVPKWRLVGSYSYLQMDIHKNIDSQDPTPDNPNGSSPRHQWYLRSSVDLPKHFEQDTTLRFVDHLPSLGLPSYYSLDAHLGWRPVNSLEFSIGGQNLLNNWHLEFMPDFVNTSPTVVKRSIFGSITVKF
ncbi:MAG: TonB-dependent receptor [Acidobacteria bacterium]|nr:MAG: TonB-dependent receptor [Acidobacteriota bacterium]PYT41709.1 MAG: TonB-dependent receptor [Acidobacteriota bacterium]PYT43235.1 MAG: TonB-dependent receptor [Acidobacteriota bacterium]